MEGSKPAPRCVRNISIIENGVVRHPMARSRDDVILAHTHISNVEFRRRIVGQHGRAPSSLRPRRLSCAMRAARDVRVAVAVAMPGSGCAPNVGLRSCPSLECVSNADPGARRRFCLHRGIGGPVGFDRTVEHLHFSPICVSQSRSVKRPDTGQVSASHSRPEHFFGHASANGESASALTVGVTQPQ
jgi:hypothetical protein